MVTPRTPKETAVVKPQETTKPVVATVQVTVPNKIGLASEAKGPIQKPIPLVLHPAIANPVGPLPQPRFSPGPLTGSLLPPRPSTIIAHRPPGSIGMFPAAQIKLF